MKKVCYWCNKHKGGRNGNHEDRVLYELCDECARWLKNLNKEKGARNDKIMLLVR